jgi:uncharacterized membrane protein YsdA (DUF1294 family)
LIPSSLWNVQHQPFQHSFEHELWLLVLLGDSSGAWHSSRDADAHLVQGGDQLIPSSLWVLVLLGDSSGAWHSSRDADAHLVQGGDQLIPSSLWVWVLLGECCLNPFASS